MLNLHYIYSVNWTEYINNIKNSKVFYVIPIWDQKVIDEFFTSHEKLNNNKTRLSWLNNHKDLYDYLLMRYKDSDSIQETIWRIKFGVEIRPVCSICGKKVNFHPPTKNLKIIFNEFCSYNCIGQSEKIKNKRIDTCLKKYGVDVSSKNKACIEKKKKTCLKKYGVDCILKNKEIRDKIKRTCIEKYGVDCAWKSDEVIEKIKRTCIEKYGVDSYLKTKEKLDKEYKTKKNNNSFNKSKGEEELYGILLECYSGVERQYKSEKYNYYCDFYIPSLDLYIEYNGHWTHGEHAFDSTNRDDIEKLNKWKEKAKTSKFYDKAIYIWTDLDVRKRNTAKENKLNYIEIWGNNINEINISDIINSYFQKQ